MTIPKFSGLDITEWQSFWETFSNIVHRDDELSESAKL
ncbi:MAG: DUF1759 domain-containing protein [Gammaproteobacteria bacterium]|nr:DUF1759 domain-containing protein [Gammaproteobacteria bacterium]